MRAPAPGTAPDGPPHGGALGPLSFYLLSVLVGVVSGLGAVAFRALIAFFHDLLFLGRISIAYDANEYTPASPWGWLVVLVPVAGALGVAFMVKNFAPEAKGHGVPEVMDAIYYGRGVIRPVVALVKALASALSIGSGGSVGREGPIIQIGSSFGSTLGQVVRMPPWQRITLVAAGAGAGIAATFNTPVGGVLFAVEIILHEVSARTLVPVALATATATWVGRIFFGVHPSFVIPAFEHPYFHLTEGWVLLAYVGLGIGLGLLSAWFIRALYAFEDFFDRRVPGNEYTRHASGMLALGVLLWLLLRWSGHYHVEGVGYSTVQDVLSGNLLDPRFLLLLFLLKLLATCLTLGSGASGGVFSPSLFLGATVGGAYGVLLSRVFPGIGLSPPAFAVAGMAGMVGGATGAAMAAVVMIFEMTLDYSVVLPMTVTVALSYGVRRLVCPESIYTMKLARRGHYMPAAMQANPHHTLRAEALMDPRLARLPGGMTLGEFAARVAEDRQPLNYLVEEDGRIVGVLNRQAALDAGEASRRATPLRSVASARFITVQPDASLFDVLALLHAHDASVALVLAPDRPGSEGRVEGVITFERIADSAVRAVDLYSD